MAPKSAQEALHILTERMKLISRGIIVQSINPDKPVKHLQSEVGGTGPRGKKFFVCFDKEENPERMVSLPIYPEDHYLAKYAIPTKRSEENSHDLITENGLILKGIPPEYKDVNLKDGKPITSVIAVHPYATSTINVSSSCRHFENNEKCKFCTTDMAMVTMGFSKRVSVESVLESVQLTLEKKIPLRTITISGGTMDDPDENLKQLIVVARRLKEVSDLSLFFQIEPCNDYSLLKEFSQYADGLGVCLDIFDDNVRKDICPGKSKTPISKYLEMWEKSVEYFGKGNIESHCLIGLGENLDVVLENIEKCASLGVKVTLLNVRAGSEELGKDFVPTYLDKEEEYLDLHIKTAEILYKYGICYDFLDGVGCIGCNGCNCMIEACEYVKLLK